MEKDLLCKQKEIKRKYFRAKNIARSKEDQFTRIKGSIHQEEITILNIYEPNIVLQNT